MKRLRFQLSSVCFDLTLFFCPDGRVKEIIKKHMTYAMNEALRLEE